MKEEKDVRQFAGFWVRVGSVVIDGFIISLVVALIIILFTLVSHAFITAASFLMFIFFGLFFSSIAVTILYFGWFNADGRQSPGKKIFKLMVVDDSFKPVPLAKSFLRAAVYAFDFLVLGLGHLLILFNKKKPALHDFMAKTYVVRAKPARKNEVLLIIAFLLACFSKGLLRTFSIQSWRIPTGALKPTLLVGNFISVLPLEAKRFTSSPAAPARKLKR